MGINEVITIVGCGVSGLTCGIKLLENGYKTKILASQIPPYTTSNIAPAYWYPFKVNPLDKVLKWGKISYGYFTRLAEAGHCGVSLTNLVKLYDREVESPPWSHITRKFKVLTRDEVPDTYTFGFQAEVPLIETPIYMSYLFNRYMDSGGELLKLDQEIKSIDDYLDENKPLINCTGLGSFNLIGDKLMYPIRGQLVRTTNPGIRNIYNDEDSHLAITYIVPRSDDCVLGGTADENNWDTVVDDDTTVRILSHSQRIAPELSDAVVVDTVVGLRPGRKEVRLEHELFNSKYGIIHNYGHGGAGFTLSWGCAEDVLELVRRRF